MPRPLLTLIPGIEHRLNAWEQIHDRLSREPAPRVRPTITLSRAFGCEGFPLADHLKGLFEAASGEPWAVYDRTLLEAVAREEGVPLHTLKTLGETARALETLGVRPKEYFEHAEAFEAVARRLLQFATVGNAVIVGRGGAVLCQQMKNCFHFRLDAELPWRAASIARRLEMPLEEAERFVASNSALRVDFVREQLRADVTALSHYDAVFNNAHHGIAEVARAVFAYVQQAWPDEQYFQAGRRQRR